MIKNFCLFVICIIFFSLSLAQEESNLFVKANDFYKNQNYDSAIVLYEKIIETDIESANMYFNLGNSYFKSGNLGRAIQNYMRAQRLDPGNDDIIANLEFAKSYTQVKMEGVELNPVSSLIVSLLAPYHLNTLAWISSIFFILLIVLLIFRFGYFMKTQLVKNMIILTLILTVSFSFLTTYKYRNDYLTKRAVLIKDDINVYSGPTDDSEIELQGAPGLIVEIINQSGDYYNVLFENKRRGWINKDLVAVI